MSDTISRGALKHLISTDAAWMWQGLQHLTKLGSSRNQLIVADSSLAEERIHFFTLFDRELYGSISPHMTPADQPLILQVEDVKQSDPRVLQGCSRTAHTCQNAYGALQLCFQLYHSQQAHHKNAGSWPQDVSFVRLSNCPQIVRLGPHISMTLTLSTEVCAQPIPLCSVYS